MVRIYYVGLRCVLNYLIDLRCKHAGSEGAEGGGGVARANDIMGTKMILACYDRNKPKRQHHPKHECTMKLAKGQLGESTRRLTTLLRITL